ncbi:PQQ-binding-like beta-propeller repeat protein [Phenylobacterium sp.]|jgi:polyvinyl alcohol dehydrogenase (cytochrome)|uniref:outer membrane protein assembly factor BamB family protein n=1 Tax=Phenylobacterium sp. TaxID=1871053 RepID=UPI002E379D4E|nr:PQQ-binding-like beta-propeller repeat protein [Phenylobacterium sp.]HEX4709165.1 PQQ-binding-like beta-propeller repeat protein [Phenylobacterium sp.]
MSFTSKLAALAALACALALPLTARAQVASPGEAVFNTRCKACHEPAIERAPNRATLATLPPATIVEALTNGVMKPMAAGLSDADKQAVAAYLAAAGRSAESAQARAPAAPVGVDVKCQVNPPIRPTGSDWVSVGLETSHRFQANPGLKAADVPKLKVKWAFSMAGGSMPTVIGDWLFITNRSGKFYALDPASGCVRWVVEGAVSRTTPMIVKSDISASGWATFIGERNRTVRAFDAQTGKEIWRSAALDANPVAGITGTPLVSGDRIFVPLTSVEEGAAHQPTYSCCSFQGSLAALDLKTGKTLWQTKVIPEALHPTHKNSAGTMMQGPAGGAIWSAPTVDAKRGLVYVATGDSYTEVETKGADAIVAMDVHTGKIRWSNQVTDKDNFIVGCTDAVKPANCPSPDGPDYDFGASPILFKLPPKKGEKGGKVVLLAGQKSGVVYGMDPDTGRTLWTTKVGGGSALGGIEWGMAADGLRLYVANADTINLIDEELRPQGKSPLAEKQPPAKPGLYALDPATGKVLWATPAPVAPCRYAGDRSRDRAGGACVRAQSAAPSVMPGVVFSGAMDGWFRAYDAASGKILWADSTTARTYDTVNQVRGQPGGSLDGMGAAIAGGRVFVMSGFNGAAGTGGNGVNVLLAYSMDGK